MYLNVLYIRCMEPFRDIKSGSVGLLYNANVLKKFKLYRFCYIFFVDIAFTFRFTPEVVDVRKLLIGDCKYAHAARLGE